MNVVERIQNKVFQLPREAQEELLEIVERIEERYHVNGNPPPTNGSNGRTLHPLRQIVSLATDVGVTDFAERHDLYANRKPEG